MTRLPYSYQAQIMGRRSFEKMYTAEQMREYAKRAVEEEREACAKVCDVLSDKHSFEGCYADECAAAIRARGNT